MRNRFKLGDKVLIQLPACPLGARGCNWISLMDKYHNTIQTIKLVPSPLAAWPSYEIEGDQNSWDFEESWLLPAGELADAIYGE